MKQVSPDRIDGRCRALHKNSSLNNRRRDRQSFGGQTSLVLHLAASNGDQARLLGSCCHSCCLPRNMSVPIRVIRIPVYRQPEEVTARNVEVERRCASLAASTAPSDSKHPVIVYDVEIVLDIIHRAGRLVEEVWLPQPYNLIVNHASDSLLGRKRVNMSRSESPRLTSTTSPRFLRHQDSLRVPQIVYVSRSWCDTIQQMYHLQCRYQEQMSVLTAMAQSDSPIQLAE